MEKAVITWAEAIKAGKLVAFPTETVYGLGANALNPTAVAKIFEVKRRPLNDPLIVHLCSLDRIEGLVEDLPEAAEKLLDAFSPGPLTVVLRKSGIVPDIVTANNPTVAIRIPSNRIARNLIRASGLPIAAPSANLFGRSSPTSAEHVKAQLSGKYALLINGGACRVGVESTVVSFVSGAPVLLRQGGIEKERIEAVIGSVSDWKAGGTQALESPGLTAKHYAPETPLIITENIQEFKDREDVGKLFFQRPAEDYSGPVLVLSEDGDLSEAAFNLYHFIRKIDELNLKFIVVEPAPDYGLGRAINDRLKKAAMT
ncbi:MAG: threonylcarbamoyl-AMP synthase [Lentisphaerae bacterium]|nr:threonylcarbamoyl-AMP synthase [Lentisphaerota bacterium]